MKYQSKISKEDNNRFTKEIVVWKESDHCTLSLWCTEMIHFSIWSQISKTSIYDYDDLYSYIWDRIIKRINNYDNNKSNAYTYIYMVISTSIIQYKKDSMLRKRVRESEIVNSRDKNQISSSEMDEIISSEIKDFVYINKNKKEKKV